MPREYYSVSEAAKTLGISVDTVRRWDRQGRLKAERDSANRRVIPASEIERLRGEPGSSQLSARNRFNATVTDVKIEGDSATATVTYHFDKAPDDKTPVPMTFVREDGAWKVCSTGPS